MALSAAALRERGLEVGLDELMEFVLAAAEGLRVGARPRPGREGMSAGELAALVRGGLDPTPRDFGTADPLARGLAEEVALLATGLTTEQAAKRLGVSPARVRQRLHGKPRTLLGVSTGPRGGWSLPAFQFTEAGELPGWAEVCAALPEHVAAADVYGWLMTPDPDLDGPTGPKTPREWLLEHGDPGPLIEAALSFDAA